MCGIAAIFSPRIPFNDQVLSHALSVLNHRGPDQRGNWYDPNGRIALGHTRLRIMDLEGGNQPMSNESGNIHAIVNGEFYEFESIRSELENRGHTFSSKSDSEILIHLYEEYGTHCLIKLRGEFAFALWDESNQTFFAARDRFGIKPLYYSQDDDMLRVASEAKALFSMGCKPRWDQDSLYQALLTEYPLENRSLFKGIYQLPPGHLLIATSGAVEVRRYWDFNYPLENSSTGYSLENAVEEYRYLLEQAIRIRLRADVPIAFYLSGGIDSASILGMSIPHLNYPAEAFTVKFVDEDYDESPLAAEIAKELQVQWHPVVLDQADLASKFPEATWHCETLSVNTHSVGKFLLSRAVRDAGFKVVLTGEGADDVLAGYSHFRMDALLHMASSIERDQGLATIEADTQQIAGMMTPTGENLPVEKAGRILGFVPSWFLAKTSMGYRCKQLFHDDFVAELGQIDVLERLLERLDLTGQVYGRAKLNQSMYLYHKSSLPNYILSVMGDRMEMAHSIEARLPFLDHHLVEFVINLPARLKVRPSDAMEKFVLREAVRGVVPESTRTRKKRGFLSPWSFSSPALEILMQDTLRSQSLPSCFDRSRITQLLDSLSDIDISERIPHEPVLAMVMSACFLQEKFGLSV